MKKAVIYARYSSDNQSEQSIEGQIRVCQEYAERNNIEIVDSYVDRAMTGTNDHRPAFQKMIKDSKNGQWDYVLVYKLDRFSRDRYETTIHKHTLKENGVKILSAMENIPDSPEGIILESLLEGMNQYYSAELSQKTKRGMKQLRIKGYWQGGSLPYGYQVIDKRIYPEEHEARIVRHIFKEYLRGSNMQKIVEDLKDMGIKTKKNKYFALSTISYILKNKLYTGYYEKDGEVFYNMYPEIVDKELFARVQTKFAVDKNGARIINRKYLLSGKMICGYCGGHVIGTSATSRNGTVYNYYQCNNKKVRKCGLKRKRRQDLEDLVVNTIIKLLNNPENKQYIIFRLLEIQESFHINNDKKYLEKKKDEIQNKIDNLLRLVEEGLFNNETKTRMRKLQQELEDVNIKLVACNEESKEIFSAEDIKKHLNKVLQLNTKDMVDMFLKRAIIYNDKIDIYINSPIDFSDEPLIYKDKKQEGIDLVNDMKYKTSKNKEIAVNVKIL